MSSNPVPHLSGDNPYAPPETRDGTGEAPLAVGSPEHIRTEHLSTEAAIQSMGLLLMLFSLAAIAAGLFSIPQVNTMPKLGALLGAIFAGFLLGNFGKAVYRLMPWTRWPLVIHCHANGPCFPGWDRSGLLFPLPTAQSEGDFGFQRRVFRYSPTNPSY